MEAGTDRWRGSRLRAVDPVEVVVLTGLVFVSFLLRRNGYSRDGLWYDDAWVVAGAIKGSIADVAVTGGAHPGFTLLLSLQHALFGGPVERLVALPLVFGIAGPAVLYGALRYLGYDRAGCILAGIGLAVTPSHVIYSGRVKSYTLDVVLVTLIMAVLPRVARRTWGWGFAACWVMVAVVAGSISGFVVVASAVAIGILVLHPAADRVVRSAALVAQALIQGSWVLYTRRFVDLDEIEEFMESAYDAHVERSANPLVMGQNLFSHLTRVVDVHPGAPSVLLTVLAVAVLGGLVMGAVGRLDRDRAIVSRFALAALTFAAVTATFDRFPFGPSNFDLSTAMGAPGARHGLWLVPVTAVGLCNLVDVSVNSLRAWVPAQSALRVAVSVWAVALLWTRWAPADEPAGGRRQLAEMVERAADEGAFIVLGEHVSYQYFVLTDRPAILRRTPEEMVGFVPEPAPDEGAVVGVVLLPETILELAATIDRDHLVIVGIDVPYDDELIEAGWERRSTFESEGLRATDWVRDST